MSNMNDVENWLREDFDIELWPNPKISIIEAAKQYFGDEDMIDTWTIVRRGTKDTRVKFVQSMLICMGYPCTLGDIFNDDCVDALKQYQKENKFIVNGLAGKAVIRRMFKEE